ncbi:hypothetical protein AXX17_ATUG04340, partial [Arabidopsis thaliana]
MNILQALFFPPEQPGGVSSMVPYIGERFRKIGWSMELFSIPRRVRNKGSEPFEFETFDWRDYAGNPVVDKYIRTIQDYIWWTKLRLKGNGQYDLIHAHHPVAALAMRHVYPDTPLLMTVHSSYERELILNRRIKEGSTEHRFLTKIYGELERKSDRLLTVSNSFASYMSPYVEQPEEIGIIPNGYDERRFKPIPHENEVAQLVTVCRLVPAKGLDVLLEACALLRKSGRKFVLHIIGDGPIRPELEELAIQLGIYEETIFYGYMLHPEEMLPFFDIFVLPSRAEAFGSVFAEAALCLLSLVGTNVGGIAEQIEDGSNGLLVPAEDPAALAEALDKLITDPHYRYELARAAWNKAKKTYSLNRVIQELKKIYVSMGPDLALLMSGTFTFMHAADLHLDSPFRGLAGVPAVVRDRLRESTFEALAAIVETARRERLDFIVIAGDLYDKADRSLRAQLRMQQAMSKLAEDNIQVFVVHGNHDPADGWQAELEWPNTVHVFGSEQPEWMPAYTREGELAAHVYGMSYASASVRDNLAAMYRKQEGAPFHLALLHANVDGQANYDNYAPCKLSDLRSASFDYWALGHIHDRRVLSEYPHVVYPGNIQGRSVKETGSRGVYVVRVCEEGRIEMSYRDVASVIWEELAVSIEGAEREQDLKHRLLDAVESVRASSGGRPVVLRLRLEGSGVLHERLMDEHAGEVWLEELREWIGSPEDEEQW